MSDSKDSLGDRMKFYEGQYSDIVLLPGIPVIARMDGRAFHNFTHDLAHPFDQRMTDLMVQVTTDLVKQTSARCGYTQSDEISLVWLAEKDNSQIFFNGRLLKMTSIMASLTTLLFNKKLEIFIPEKAEKWLPVFDARVWSVPTVQEAANYFLWREMDATRNSISMAAQSMFSHRQLHKKNTSEMQEMMFQVGFNWNKYPVFFKRGTFVRTKKETRVFTSHEMEKLPAHHEARTNPDLQVTRSLVEPEILPPLRKVTNRVEVILNGATPDRRSVSE